MNVLEEFHYIICFVEEFQQTHSVGTYISTSSSLLSQTETTKQTTQSLKPQILHLIAQSKWFETNLSGNRNTYTLRKEKSLNVLNRTENIIDVKI